MDPIESHESHLSATTVLDDGYDSGAHQNHNAAIESKGPQEIDKPELGEALDTSSPGEADDVKQMIIK